MHTDNLIKKIKHYTLYLETSENKLNQQIIAVYGTFNMKPSSLKGALGFVKPAAVVDSENNLIF